MISENLTDHGLHPADRGQPELPKCPTGIHGLDEITNGGLPCGRATLVCGSAGCGKTLLALEFIVNGAIRWNEPGVIMLFEETAGELARNSASLGYDLDDLIARKLLVIDYVRIERSEIEETGEYDLEALFIRLDHAIGAIGAKRVALDTLETLFACLGNEAILRSELRRLFRWLKARGVTTVVTGERGDGQLTRYGLEEYVADCVIFLDLVCTEEVATRKLRVIKYRGSSHCTNNFPFLIDHRGITVWPVTSVDLDYSVLTERISSGIPRLDTMLGGEGFYRGSSILISGTAGTGKTSLAAHFIDASCRRGERCIYFAFEESPGQIIRNMRSIGLDLESWVRAGLLKLHAKHPSMSGLELHLVDTFDLIDRFRPQCVVIDPISNLTSVGSTHEVMFMLLRLMHTLKQRQITSVLINLSSGREEEMTEVHVSSMADTWILLRALVGDGERNLGMYVMKSRGMSHSNQVREFTLTGQGVELKDVYLGRSGLLTGSRRLIQEQEDRLQDEQKKQEASRKKRLLLRKCQVLEAQIASLQQELANEAEELQVLSEQGQAELQSSAHGLEEIARSRQAMSP